MAARIAGTEGGTQIGACLRQFGERYPAAIGDRATVVVVSDGWDRADATAVAEELRKIQRLQPSRRVGEPVCPAIGFEARTAGLVSALPFTDALLGPEDFQSPFPLKAIAWKDARFPAAA